MQCEISLSLSLSFAKRNICRTVGVNETGRSNREGPIVFSDRGISRSRDYASLTRYVTILTGREKERRERGRDAGKGGWGALGTERTQVSSPTWH